MELLKKHIIFFSGISICLLVLTAGLFFSALNVLDLNKILSDYSTTERSLNVFVCKPSPVVENVSLRIESSKTIR